MLSLRMPNPPPVPQPGPSLRLLWLGGGHCQLCPPAGPAPRCPLHPQEPGALPGGQALALVAAAEPRAALAQRQPGGGAAPGKRSKHQAAGWDGMEREGMGWDGAGGTGSGGVL